VTTISETVALGADAGAGAVWAQAAAGIASARPAREAMDHCFAKNLTF
jgi:hypothetical protein